MGDLQGGLQVAWLVASGMHALVEVVVAVVVERHDLHQEQVLHPEEEVIGQELLHETDWKSAEKCRRQRVDMYECQVHAIDQPCCPDAACSCLRKDHAADTVVACRFACHASEGSPVLAFLAVLAWVVMAVQAWVVHDASADASVHADAAQVVLVYVTCHGDPWLQ